MRLTVPRISIGILMAACTAIASPVRGQVEAELKLPVTMDKVWFRAEKKHGLEKLRGFKHSGQLTITDAGLEFVAKKNSFFFPMDSLTMISFGKMGNNVENDWAVVGIREGETTRVIGFRDGRKLGYGSDSESIYRNLRLAAKQHGVAQFRAPKGFKPYAALDPQLAIVVPEDWNVYVLTAVFIGQAAPWGKTVFSPAEFEQLEYRDSDPDLRRMYEGELPAILLNRTEAGNGMNCDGLSPKAIEKVRARAAEDRIFGREPGTIDPASVSEQTIAGCRGIKIEGKTRGADGVERLLDLRVFANGGTLFTFGIRSQVDLYPSRRREFESVLEKLRLPIAMR